MLLIIHFSLLIIIKYMLSLIFLKVNCYTNLSNYFKTKKIWRLSRQLFIVELKTYNTFYKILQISLKSNFKLSTNLAQYMDNCIIKVV